MLTFMARISAVLDLDRHSSVAIGFALECSRHSKGLMSRGRGDVCVAAAALGLHDDAATLRIGKTMVDHALRYGWDDALGAPQGVHGATLPIATGCAFRETADETTLWVTTRDRGIWITLLP